MTGPMKILTFKTTYGDSITGYVQQMDEDQTYLVDVEVITPTGITEYYGTLIVHSEDVVEIWEGNKRVWEW